MPNARRIVGVVLESVIVLLTLTSGGYAMEEKTLELKEATFLGRAGDQGANWSGMGVATDRAHLYVGCVDMSAAQALALKYAIEPTLSPVWAFWSPNRASSGNPDAEVFTGAVATSDAVYFAGRSWYLTSDGIGDKEAKATLAKFLLQPPAGGDAGRPLWIAKPNFFSYRGHETYMAVTATTEAGSSVIYATGQAQANGLNNTVILAKYDAHGALLWSRVLGNTGFFMNSYAHGVVGHNGSVYVAGYTHYPYYRSDNMQATLWKYDASGNQLWMKTFNKPLPIPVLRTVTVAASEGALYLATALRDGPSGGIDALLLKYDEAGNLLWSNTWGGKATDLSKGLTIADGRLFVVGETTSFGAGNKDAFVLEADPKDGSAISTAYYGGAEDDIAHTVLAIGSDLFVVGESRSFATTVPTSRGTSTNPAGANDPMLLRYRIIPREIVVPIDIKPGEVPNSINLKSHGKVTVAILSTAAFDAPAQVNTPSLTFGRTGTEASVAFCSGPKDVNADGLLDVVCHFNTEQTAFQATDNQGLLKGLTLSGRRIQGIDAVRIVPLTR